jgi:hypothetical protein
MAGMSFWRGFWLTRLSKPAGERPIYRHVLRRRPATILELGLGTLGRTERLLKASGGGVRYVGIDRFEAREPGESAGVTLKQAHRRLHALGRVQLVPGNADAALARLCNHLGTFDLVLIAAEIDDTILERCWFFLERVTRGDTTLFLEPRTSGRAAAWEVVSKRQVDERAARAVRPALRRAG